MTDNDESKGGVAGEVRRSRKKSAQHDETTRQLREAGEALQSERASRVSDQEKSQAVIGALQREVTAAHAEHAEKQRDADLRIDRMKKEQAERIDFFTIISHDLRGPIGTLTQYLDLMLSRFDALERETLRDYIARLDKIAQSLAHLTDSLLTWTRYKLDRFRCDWGYVDVNALVVENFRLFSPACEHKGISLVNALKGPVRVYADCDMINAAIRNIVSNATKFTQRDGEIRIQAEPKDDGVLISISDNGIGMAAGRLRNVFAPTPDRTLASGGTAGEKGAGLGLLLCRELVVKSGGEIWVESEEGQGTTVFLQLLSRPGDTTGDKGP